MSESLSDQLNEVSSKVNAIIEKVMRTEKEPRMLYAAAQHLIKAGGKRLRPFLVLKACELVGGREESAMSSAVAVELLHNFTLIHDDIMDRDEKRRGVPTVHTLWGEPLAITAGDLLFAKVFEVIIRYSDPKYLPPEKIIQVLNTLSIATIAICEGQALDIEFEHREDVSEEEYFTMIGGKTASLFRAAAESGAIVGGGSTEQIQRLGMYAYNSGLSFQIADDVLGLTAEEEALGKPIGSDIKEGKKTILIVHALKHANPEQRRNILAVMGNRAATSKQIERVIEIIRSLGSIEYATRKAVELVTIAREQLNFFPNVPAKRALLDLADFLVARKY